MEGRLSFRVKAHNIHSLVRHADLVSLHFAVASRVRHKMLTCAICVSAHPFTIGLSHSEQCGQLRWVIMKGVLLRLSGSVLIHWCLYDYCCRGGAICLCELDQHCSGKRPWLQTCPAHGSQHRLSLHVRWRWYSPLVRVPVFKLTVNTITPQSLTWTPIWNVHNSGVSSHLMLWPPKNANMSLHHVVTHYTGDIDTNTWKWQNQKMPGGLYYLSCWIEMKPLCLHEVIKCRDCFGSKMINLSVPDTIDERTINKKKLTAFTIQVG